jgi:hypothetical protein
MAIDAICASCTRIASSSWVKSPSKRSDSWMSPMFRASRPVSGAASHPRMRGERPGDGIPATAGVGGASCQPLRRSNSTCVIRIGRLDWTTCR